MGAAPEQSKPQVLIVGGGVAGLEALLALRDLADERVELTLAAPEEDFTYTPLTVTEPFSFRPAESHGRARPRWGPRPRPAGRVAAARRTTDRVPVPPWGPVSR